MNSQSQSINVMADTTGRDVKEIKKQQTETLRTPKPNESYYKRPNFAEIPLLVNGLLSDDPEMRAHITEQLVSIALQGIYSIIYYILISY
ncbi:MAG: hypothetical protein EZS28_012658 [Streblomastix strix]|uniref:Uncharacterized protein n=1 Tax=Streblomastix strix TaxID=222440 RepID=A0A5J4WA52_9EUKA|nr:MAG: hypothetical protein EZS28_012658 [Streblomastix strix]